MNSHALPDPASEYPTLAAFENATLNADTFNHEAHVYVAWRLLQECSPLAAIERFSAALRKITEKHGAQAKYNETITWFFVLLINERLAQSSDEEWPSFKAANPDLISNGSALLKRHYSNERLWSDLARRRFLLPDKAAMATRC